MELKEGKEAKDKIKIRIVDLLKSHNEGLSIAEMMEMTGLARHTLLARLHSLIGEGKIKVRQINMAKLHYWKDDAPDTKEEVKSVFKSEVKLNPIKEENIRRKSDKSLEKEKENKGSKESRAINGEKLEVEKLKEEIEDRLRRVGASRKQEIVLEQREPIKKSVGETLEKSPEKRNKTFVETGIPGFDELMDEGIPEGNSIILAGGAGSGKTIFCLQTLVNHSTKGEKCLYMSFEESKESLIEHMDDFGWEPRKLMDEGNLRIERFNPFDITRNVDALLAQQKGELLIDIDPMIIPEDFKPSFIVIDSLTAIASAFTGKEDSYRIYIEQLFRFFEKIGATSFLITETEQIPKIFSQTGVEEFLADGVIVIYSIKHGNVRENAIEVLKLRGASHKKKIVAMQITGKGVVVYPEQEVFSEI